LTGLLAYARFGPAGTKGVAPVPEPRPLIMPALVVLVPAFGLALWTGLGAVPGSRDALAAAPMAAVASLVLVAGAAQLVVSRRKPGSPYPFPGEAPPVPGSAVGHRVALAGVLLLALFRGYAGPVLHDWPFMRGVDHYSHAVMANLMMTRGEIEPYLIYPPGFHTLTAMVSRLSGLEPLEIFPVLAPVLLLLPPLACYTLARRVWGRPHGLAAALFSGVLLGGTYYYYNDAMYPNLVTSQFLLVLTIAALAGLYASPSPRAGLLFSLLGSSVVLYHPVASLYEAALLAAVALVFVPYLLARGRREGLALLASLALLGSLAVVYAWDTYDLPRAVAGLVDGSGAGASATAVGMAVGTQATYPLGFLVGTMVTQPVVWLGLLGALLVVADLIGGRVSRPQALAQITVLLWALLLFAGSRMPLTGFPQRFGRDVGVPAAILAAVAVVAIWRSLGPRRPAVVFAASTVALLVGSSVAFGTVQSLKIAAGPSVQLTITPQIAAAGAWLKEHNDDGNIMVSPHANQVPSRMMLAMGGYSALQSFEPWQIANPRDLPPTGPQPPRDVLWVMRHPVDGRTRQLLERHDVGYVVLYKNMPDRPTLDYWMAFRASPGAYRVAFENKDVLIVARRGA
ncbi:MAG TPA: hypothetical protein VKA73_09495, partial [Rubrobacter sp.]|nr:hypothetical protein [Rubrobacter sp.]